MNIILWWAITGFFLLAGIYNTEDPQYSNKEFGILCLFCGPIAWVIFLIVLLNDYIKQK